MARKTPEINSSSQADIAFLLLCFFLMSTSMSKDFGITRRLPPPVQQNEEDVKVKERNVMNVNINRSDKLLVNMQEADIHELTEMVKDFMTPKPNDETAPEVKYETSKDFPEFGEIPMSEGIVSLKNDRGTSYSMYLSVQNELARAFNEMKEDMSKKYFKKSYSKLNEIQTDFINEFLPVRISEAEPVEYKK